MYTYTQIYIYIYICPLRGMFIFSILLPNIASLVKLTWKVWIRGLSMSLKWLKLSWPCNCETLVPSSMNSKRPGTWNTVCTVVWMADLGGFQLLPAPLPQPLAWSSLSTACSRNLCGLALTHPQRGIKCTTVHLQGGRVQMRDCFAVCAVLPRTLLPLPQLTVHITIFYC
jgi:hypothetical protein